MSLHEFLMEDPQCDQLLTGAVLAVGPMLEDPDPAPTLARVAGWAFELAGRMPLPWNFHGAIDALNHYLFQEVGLQGDQETYDDPANAAIPQVIERQAGHAHHPVHPLDGRGPPAGLQRRGGGPARPLHHRPAGWTWASCTSTPSTAAAPWATRTRPGWWSGHRRAGRLRPGHADACLQPRHPGPPGAQPARALPARPDAWAEALWTSTHLVLLYPGESLPYRDRAFVHFKRGRDGGRHAGPQRGHPAGPGDRSGTGAVDGKAAAGVDAWISHASSNWRVPTAGRAFPSGASCSGRPCSGWAWCACTWPCTGRRRPGRSASARSARPSCARSTARRS